MTGVQTCALPIYKKFKPIIYTKTKEDEDISKVFVEKLAEVTNSSRTKII